MHRFICLACVWLNIALAIAQVQLSGLPDQTIGRWGSFESLPLEEYLSDTLVLSWSYEFLASATPDSSPVWSLNPASFDFSMNLTAQVNGGQASTAGESNMLGAFINNELAGVAYETEVGGTHLFFMTIYHNLDSGDIVLKYFHADQNALYPVVQSLAFIPNGSIGSPLTPAKLSAGYIEVTLDQSIAAFHVVDSVWFGSQGIVFHGSGGGQNVDDTLLLTIVDNYTPVWRDIPDQIIPKGGFFLTRNLNDFVLRGDGDPVSFQAWGSDHLSVVLQNSSLSVLLPDPDWVGKDSILITVRDQTPSSLTSITYVQYEVIGDDHIPLLERIPDQQTTLGGSFLNIELTDYLTEVDGDSVAYAYQVLPPTEIDSLPNWSINPSEFSVSMTLTATSAHMQDTISSEEYLLGAFVNDSLRGVASPQLIGDKWIFFLLIYGETSGETVHFYLYDIDQQRLMPVRDSVFFQSGDIIGDPVNPFVLRAGPIQFELIDSYVSFEWIAPDWQGTETVAFQAKDYGTSYQFASWDTIQLIVSDAPFPNLAVVPNQHIYEGQNFQPIDLSAYLSGYEVDSVRWEVLGNEELNAQINGTTLEVHPPDTNWYGEEELFLRVYDHADSSISVWQYVWFEVENINDSPRFESQALVMAEIGQAYLYEIQAADIDNDSLTILGIELPDWLSLLDGGEGEAILYGTPEGSELGSDRVQLRVVDGAGAYADQSFLIQVDSAQTTAIEDFPVHFRVYPIPLREGSLTIDFGEAYPDQVDIRILDELGRIVQDWHFLPGSTRMEIKLDALSNGRYYVLIYQQEEGILRRASLPIEVRK